jgi:alpha-tubulin suppressor-like RCC1 family protein
MIHRSARSWRWLLSLALLLSFLHVGVLAVPVVAAAAPGGTALGGVWSWGSDSYGQLGNGATTTAAQHTPAALTSVTGITAIAGGFGHSLALKRDSTVLAWGNDQLGQLGNGAAATADQPAPVAVVNVGGSAGTLSGVVAIAAGTGHSLALRSNGTVFAWGSDAAGQLGNGAAVTADQPAPVQVRGVGGTGNLTNVIAIAAGGVHSLALRSDGTVVAWGSDVFGQLGNGAAVGANQHMPVVVVGVGDQGLLTTATAIAAGANHSLALRSDGSVVAWGRDNTGQLGNGSAVTADQPAPVLAVGLGDQGLLNAATAIAAGANHSLARKVDGTVVAWGSDANGQLGNGAASANQPVPVPVASFGGTGVLTGVTAIASGSSHVLALRSNGTIVAWGNDLDGQVGNGADATTLWPAPVIVKDPTGRELTGMTAISGGGAHSLALQGGAVAAAWGWDGYGQLGDGTVASPEIQPLPQSVTVLDAPRAIAVAIGRGASLALRTDGTVVAWGGNAYGELGNGTIGSPQPVPTRVLGVGGTGNLTNVVAIAAGANHSVALRSDGTVVAWGRDADGQLGNGAAVTGDQTAPTQVVGIGGSGVLAGVVAIAAGGSHSLALRADGSVVAWGRDLLGQVGDGPSIGDKTAPVMVLGVGSSRTLTDVIAIAAGVEHSLALRADGTVVAWGSDFSGELGDGPSPTGNQTVPTQVLGLGGNGVLTGVAVIAAGGDSLALRADGTVVAWGSDFYGQLGNGSAVTANQHAPVQVLGVGGSGVLTNVVAIASGHFSQALRSNGRVVAWGIDDYGQLGDNATLADQPSPVLVAIGGVAALAQSRSAWHTVVLTR